MQIIAIVVGVMRYKRLSPTQRLTLWMIGLVMLNYMASRAYIGIVRNSYPFFYSYIVIEFGFLAYIFHRKLDILSSRVFVPLAIGAVTLFTIASGLWQSYWKFPSHARGLESLLVVSFCALYFIQVLRRLDVEGLERTFMFWMSTGLLIYFATNVVITLFGSVLASEAASSVWGAIWSIHGVLNILLYLAFSIAFFCRDVDPQPASRELLDS